MSLETAGRIARPVAVGTTCRTASKTTQQTTLQAVPQAGVSVPQQTAQAFDSSGFITANPEEVDDTNLSHCPSGVSARSGGISYIESTLVECRIRSSMARVFGSSSIMFTQVSFRPALLGLLPTYTPAGGILAPRMSCKLRITRAGVATGATPLSASGSAYGCDPWAHPMSEPRSYRMQVVSTAVGTAHGSSVWSQGSISPPLLLQSSLRYVSAAVLW